MFLWPSEYSNLYLCFVVGGLFLGASSSARRSCRSISPLEKPTKLSIDISVFIIVVGVPLRYSYLLLLFSIFSCVFFSFIFSFRFVRLACRAISLLAFVSALVNLMMCFELDYGFFSRWFGSFRVRYRFFRLVYLFCAFIFNLINKCDETHE